MHRMYSMITVIWSISAWTSSIIWCPNWPMLITPLSWDWRRGLKRWYLSQRFNISSIKGEEIYFGRVDIRIGCIFIHRPKKQIVCLLFSFIISCSCSWSNKYSRGLMSTLAWISPWRASRVTTWVPENKHQYVCNQDVAPPNASSKSACSSRLFTDDNESMENVRKSC